MNSSRTRLSNPKLQLHDSLDDYLAQEDRPSRVKADKFRLLIY